MSMLLGLMLDLDPADPDDPNDPSDPSAPSAPSAPGAAAALMIDAGVQGADPHMHEDVGMNTVAAEDVNAVTMANAEAASLREGLNGPQGMSLLAPPHCQSQSQ